MLVASSLTIDTHAVATRHHAATRMLDRDKILAHPGLRPLLKVQADTFLELQQKVPRLAAIFATQQRYLLAQLASAMIFQSGGQGMIISHYLSAVRDHGIASRNTAQVFISQMLHYGIVKNAAQGSDRRLRPVLMAQPTAEAISSWLALHLRSLDALDGGERSIIFAQRPDLLAQMYPIVVSRMLASQAIMQPTRIFALFNWMNDGGLLMDKLVSSLDDDAGNGDRFPTFVQSFGQLAEPLRISRTHLLRKLEIFEREGHVGWLGKRGASTFWISRDFLNEYVFYQADKLANIEAAWQVMGERG